MSRSQVMSHRYYVWSKAKDGFPPVHHFLERKAHKKSLMRVSRHHAHLENFAKNLPETIIPRITLIL